MSTGCRLRLSSSSSLEPPLPPRHRKGVGNLASPVSVTRSLSQRKTQTQKRRRARAPWRKICASR